MLIPYLIVGFWTALIVGYTVYKMIQGILFVRGQFGMPHHAVHYPPISPTMAIPTKQENGLPNNLLVIVLLIITVVFLFFSFMDKANFSFFSPLATQPKKEKKFKNVKPSNASLASFTSTSNFKEQTPTDATPFFKELAVSKQEDVKENTETKEFYLQVRASQDWESVIKRAQQFHMEHETYIGVNDSALPYKILIGPFNDFRNAKKFKKKYSKKFKGAFSIDGETMNEIYSLPN